MNACLSVNPKKLAVIASCLCSNPTSKTLHDFPDMPKVIESC